MRQITLDGFDADQVELMRRLESWPQSFATIRYQTGWSFERASLAVCGLEAAGKIIKDWDGSYRPFNAAWGERA